MQVRRASGQVPGQQRERELEPAKAVIAEAQIDVALQAQ